MFGYTAQLGYRSSALSSLDGQLPNVVFKLIAFY